MTAPGRPPVLAHRRAGAETAVLRAFVDMLQKCAPAFLRGVWTKKIRGNFCWFSPGCESYGAKLTAVFCFAVLWHGTWRARSMSGPQAEHASWNGPNVPWILGILFDPRGSGHFGPKTGQKMQAWGKTKCYML